MLPEIIAKKILSSQKEIIVSALKNKGNIDEIVELLTSHINEEDGKFEIEDHLLKSINTLQKSLD